MSRAPTRKRLGSRDASQAGSLQATKARGTRQVSLTFFQAPDMIIYGHMWHLVSEEGGFGLVIPRLRGKEVLQERMRSAS